MSWLHAFVLFAVQLIGLFSVAHALSSVRTSQGTIAWVVSLLALPIVAVPLYWVFGRNQFYGYILARRATAPAFTGIRDHLVGQAGTFRAAGIKERPNLVVLEQLALMPFTSGNQTKLLVDGTETFEAILHQIDLAQQTVLVQFFIVRDDDLGNRLADALIDCARRGVRAYLLYDGIGSHSLSSAYLRKLADGGVQVSTFNASRGWSNRLQLNFRNHRKIVVVDSKIAFIGGHNVGDEYLGKSERFGHWRDTHIQFAGPAVIAAQLVFAEDWHWATGSVPELDWAIPFEAEGSTNLLVLPSGPADQVETCGLFFAQTIHAARKRLWIASPYFVPDESIMGALKIAALKGVDVRIMLPAKPDHYLVYLASFASIPSAAKAGVRFFRYHAGFLHQKVMLVDDRLCSIGTANLDNRSFRLNFEITVVSDDRELAHQVETMLERDFAACRDATNEDYYARPFWFRLMVRGANLMAPVL